MESLYQNCVSQFDIDLLEQATPDSQNASWAIPNAAARKQNFRFLKIRWKQVSDLVKRGKETNKILEDVQKQLFEKNEECKDLCNERNTLFNQSNESAKEIEALKIQNKLLQEKYFDAMNSISATQIHSMQFKELTIEYEKAQNNIKRIERNRVKEKHAKELAETRLKKILTEYVSSKKKKGNKWLNKIYRTYGVKQGNNNDSSEDSCTDDMYDDIPISMSPTFDRKDSEDDKKSNANGDTKPKNVDVNVELVAIKNATSDFDNFGSVDTGRGSSLAFSDKSLHSPDYYMHDSPLSTPNLCHKCHVAKSDVGTSPIPQEMLHSAQNDVGNNKLKTDAFTSPVNIFDLVTDPDTSDITSKVVEFEPIQCDRQAGLEKSNIKDHKYNRGVESDSISDDESSTVTTLQSTETPPNEEYIHKNSLQENEMPTVCKKDMSSSQNSILEKNLSVHDSTIAISKQNMNCGNTVESNVGDDHDMDMDQTTTTKTESIKEIKKRELHDGLSNGNLKVNQSDLKRNDWVTSTELPNLPAKIIQDIRPSLELNIYRHSMEEIEENSNDDKVVHDTCMDSSTSITAKEVINSSELVSSIENVTVLHIELEEESVDNHMITAETNLNKELPETSDKLTVKTTDLEQSISKRDKLQKCLQLNNSDNLDDDNTNDCEIQMIINKMTSLQPIITPIPRTPSKISESPRKTSGLEKRTSNIVDKSDDNVESVMASGGIDEYLNVIRKKTREAVGLFGSLPGFIEKFIITNMCKDKDNQELLRCLIQMGPKSSEPEHTAQENRTHEMQTEIDNEESNVNTQADVLIETDVAHCTTESMLSSAKQKKLNDTIIYENVENASEDDALEENWDSDASNEADSNILGRGIINLRRIARKKLTKLQRFKLKMLPRCKIRSDLRRPRAKKLKFKPKPIRPAIVKRKVTDADTSATLNEKSVYDKAVKVVAEFNAKNMLRKEARVIIEDCAIIRNCNKISDISKENNKTQDLETSDVRLTHKNDTKKTDIVVSKRLLRNSLDKSDLLDNVTEKVNRKRKISDSQSLDENTLCDKNTGMTNRVGDPMQINRRGRRGICSRKSSGNDDVEMCDKNSDKEPNTRRRGIGSRKTSNNQSNNIDSEIIDEIVPKKSKPDEEFSSQRILRSSNVKQVENINSNNHEVFEKIDRCDNVAIANKDMRQVNDTSFRSRRFSTRVSVLNENKDKCENDTLSYITTDSVNDARSRNRRHRRLSDQNEDKDQCENYEIPNKKPGQINDSSFRNPRLSGRLSDQNENTCNQESNKNNSESTKTSEKNILCTMIEKYAAPNGFFPKKIPESVINDKCDKLEKCLDAINEMPSSSCTEAMNKLVADIRNWKIKHFLAAFTKYLKNPQRKIELYKKTINPPAPTMTKKEQVWIYVLDQLVKSNWCDRLIVKVLEIIEYTLFTLNKTPEMDVIESMSHFYALICRYYMKQSRLRLFVVDAMYCLNYKAIPLVLQCLEVWMFILPLGHMGLAKTPLVACLVYLLHFYKCGRETSSAVQEMRTILHRKYYYDFSEWNETRMLDMFRASILELRDSDLEKKMLRMSLIILAKRSGPKWCQINIIKNMLQPIIESAAASSIAKRFCVLALGPLVKPYPNDMKSYSEVIAHYLMKKLEQDNSQKMQEAIVTSLLFMNKHNSRINEYLFKWYPNNISPELEEILRDYVRSKSVKAWKHIFSDNVTV